MNEVKLDAFHELQRAARELGLEVVLVGALARQIIFDQQVHGEAFRATHDIDAVVRVQDWEAYGALRNILIGRGFTAAPDYRFRYQDGTDLDLLPFGGVEDDSGNLGWQSPRVVSMRGFASATSDTETRRVNGSEVQVVNLVGLMILKFFAYRDRRGWDRKDLADMLYLLQNATEYYGVELYPSLPGDVLQNLEYEQVGPYHLGVLIKVAVSNLEAEEMTEILDGSILAPPLSDLASLNQDAAVEFASLFQALRWGLTGTDPNSPG